MALELKLSERDVDVLRLILRSPDHGHGWRTVSSVCWPLIAGFESRELIECVPSEDGGGTVRLTDRGATLMAYA